MKRTQKIANICILVGVAAGVGFAFWMPFLPGWCAVAIGVVVAAAAYAAAIDQKSKETIIDSDTLNRRNRSDR
jgi:hypothetical protein